MTEVKQRTLILRERYDLTVSERSLIERGLLLAESLGKEEGAGKTKSAANLTEEDKAKIEWLSHAIALEQMKDWQRLYDWCLKWTKSEPENADAWASLGDAYYELNHYDDAIEAYRQALIINPGNSFYWHCLGSAYQRQMRFSKAIDAYYKALRINPGDASYWYALGTAYIHRMHNDDAIEAFQQALRINPEDASSWDGLGFAYLLSGNRTAALAVVQKLRGLDPGRADTLFNLIVPR